MHNFHFFAREKSISHYRQYGYCRGKVVSVRFNKIMPGDGRRIDVMLAKGTDQRLNMTQSGKCQKKQESNRHVRAVKGAPALNKKELITPNDFHPTYVIIYFF